jgi:thiamine-phosphate pyrophosphorylase
MPTVADLARRLNSRHADGWRLPSLVLMSDSRRLADPIRAVERLPADAMVLFRHYQDPNREAKAAALLEVCRQRGLALLIAADWRLAARLGADGVHLPEALAGTAPAIRRGRRWLVTAAAHSERALRQAARAGVDAVLLSPVFPTASHPGARTLGAVRFAGLVRRAAVPVYALGGIDASTAPRLGHSGAVGIAAIGALIPD